MKAVAGRSEPKRSRPILTIVIVFAVMMLHGRFVVPHLPGLDTWYFDALVAAAACTATTRIIARWGGSR